MSNHTATALQGFAEAQKVQLAYEVGAALDYPYQSTVIEFAYRFMNAGLGYLGPASQHNTADRLSSGQIRYHIVSVGVRLYYDYTA